VIVRLFLYSMSWVWGNRWLFVFFFIFNEITKKDEHSPHTPGSTHWIKKKTNNHLLPQTQLIEYKKRRTITSYLRLNSLNIKKRRTITSYLRLNSLNIKKTNNHLLPQTQLIEYKKKTNNHLLPQTQLMSFLYSVSCVLGNRWFIVFFYIQWVESEVRGDCSSFFIFNELSLR
jgi:hypothetical protein